jgi:nucleoside-diphosphate-sugar epimerase
VCIELLFVASNASCLASLLTLIICVYCNASFTLQILYSNIGTCKLIDAAKSAGIKKIVLVSSILTNGRAWGQEKSPGFVVTNAFGNVLDEKLVAENYLRKSGIDYTIVRPGGLKAKPPSGALRISGEDTLIAGEISRDLVADVCVASLTDGKASNKVLEIIEDEETEPKVFNGLNM